MLTGRLQESGAWLALTKNLGRRPEENDRVPGRKAVTPPE